MPRPDGRKAQQLRRVSIRRGVTRNAAGSALIQCGHTHVLCTACIEEAVPAWRAGSGLGWVTAEYDMLPGSTGQRRARNRGVKIDGRTQEIQRLIGRSLRAVVDMAKLGERCIWIDCDVLQADGGTRTASITGAYVALADAIADLRKRRLIAANPLADSVAAVSVGMVKGKIVLDLNYDEDRDADVDFNVVQMGGGRFVEVQGTGEAATFTRTEMNRIVALAEKGIAQLARAQNQALRGRRAAR